jgi:hypothetical protein
MIRFENWKGDPMQTTRRRFIVAAVTFSVIAANLPGSAWLKTSAAWAESADESNGLLVRLARLLFPHDGMADSVYAEVIDDVLAATASDPAMTAALQSAESAFDSQRGDPWMGLDELEQIAVLQELQDEAFFAAILSTVRRHFYYNKLVWKHLDYPGSSREFGGYIHRGFNDIDWIPEES